MPASIYIPHTKTNYIHSFHTSPIHQPTSQIRFLKIFFRILIRNLIFEMKILNSSQMSLLLYVPTRSEIGKKLEFQGINNL